MIKILVQDSSSGIIDTTSSDLKIKDSNSGIIDTTSSDLKIKDTSSGIFDTTSSDLKIKDSNSGIIDTTSSDLKIKDTSSDIIDTTSSDLKIKDTISGIIDTTSTDLKIKDTSSGIIDTTSLDLSDKATVSELVNEVTGKITDTINSVLTEETTNTESIGNNTEPVDEIAFRQVCHFRIDKVFKKIFFFFIGIVFKPIKARSYLKITTNLNKKDDKQVEQDVTCYAEENVDLKDGEQKQANLKCEVDVEEPEEYNGLEVVLDKVNISGNISGVPTDPNLLNPAKVDELIEIGEVKNYSLPENKEEPIPVFNATSIDTNNNRCFLYKWRSSR